MPDAQTARTPEPVADNTAESVEPQPGKPVAPEIQEVRENTRTQVTSLNVEQIKRAGTHEEKTRLIDELVSPIPAADTMELIFSLAPTQAVTLVPKVISKSESNIGIDLAVRDGKTVFSILKDQGLQLALVEKLDVEGVKEHLVKFFEEAKSDNVRLALVKKMREQLKSNQDLLDAIKTTNAPEVLRALLNRVPEAGISFDLYKEIEEAIKKKPMLTVFLKSKAWRKFAGNYSKSGPERLADDHVINPAKNTWTRITGWFSRTWGRIRGLFGRKKEPEIPMPEEPLSLPPTEKPSGGSSMRVNS
ncbi:MAG: hypothetical protein ABH856_00005 [Patescibacteria group bacterium]|nr:hypothetical protein [Patescibacteria group bacterium]